MRNILVHMYNEADHRRVWQVAEVELPKLISELETL